MTFISFFFNDPATTEIYTLSLHDALPISQLSSDWYWEQDAEFRFTTFTGGDRAAKWGDDQEDRKSTRLNSSHVEISYAVFCLKKKKTSQTFSLTYTFTLTNSQSSSLPYFS